MKAQVSKSTKKVITTIMIVLTLGFTGIANAQGISSFIAMISPASHLNFSSVESSSELKSTAETDNKLAVEDWMSSENYWTGNEQDQQLNIEGWMSSESYWGVNENEQGSDSPLTVQNWMTSDHYWMGQQKSDGTLALENWMTSNNYWGVK